MLSGAVFIYIIFMPVLKQNQVFAGRYVLSQLIGEGGFSEVWKAMDQMADDAVVAIKIYAPNKGLDDFGLRQFRNEFSITYNLSHPHLLKVYHFDIAEGSPYLIMPYCPYGSLTSVLQENGVFSERQVALVMSQIGSALEEVHRQDPPIIHQDIKPDNILLLQPENYMLADFGISSRIRHTLRKATSTMQTLTVAYAPPERFAKHPTSDPSSDIFSFGVTLYEMCTNSVPWDGAGGQCLLKGAVIPALPDSYSPELNKILEACMALDRTERPTAAEIQARGKHFLETGQWRLPKQKKAGRSGKKAVVFTLLAAAVALLALGGFWLSGGDLDLGAAVNRQAVNTASVVETDAAPVVEEDKDDNQLEDKLKNMEAELLKANQRFNTQDSINKRMAENDSVENIDKELMVSQEREQPQPKAPTKEDNLKKISEELQQSLNQISDPQHSRERRSAWKQETLARFADGSVRVLDESDGAIQEYRAGIFLTLLLTSPHQVVVKEVKTDQNNKITELRLSKQALRASL